MKIVDINERLAISGQPNTDEFINFARRGYRSIINLRPDGEEPNQPGNDAEQAAARRAGLAYNFVPVIGTSITEADIQAFQRAIATTEGSVLVHCKSGTRALMLYALSEVIDGRMKRDEVEALGHAHGFDLGRAVTWLKRQAIQTPRVSGFFDPRTGSIQYVVTDQTTKRCAIIDPVLDFDEKSGRYRNDKR